VEKPAVQGKVRVRPKVRAPRNRAALAGLGLVAASVLLLELGLTLGFGGRTLWSTVPLWSAFATVAALLGGLAFAGRQRKGERLRNDRAWKLSVVGLAGLAVFWVLVVLPVAATDRGFLLTAALACLGVALWIAPGRRA
jgi:peptidoglycan/LPS O-acetylase OafA/YrhL